ncbi:DUF6360 family protein [Natronolimnobius baerhuensis]|uniref:Uncharacterized protein n=1 Tax=Natronolimnobius baerhuensis TaxID=253108 RepID=A0A202EA64_9EURY|nr:DUF6360 family protein [Natronolimnobius baerhuensis]OVE85141.1 hypothetical protein B2G88_12425 [Natronolimnobius baerhuensis]
MSNRFISVTARTTLEYVEATVTGESFDRESIAVVNATTATDDPDCVRLQTELDTVTETHLPQHLDEFELTPDQARTLATALETHADRVENATDSTDE